MKENLNDVKTSHSDGKTIVKMETLHNEIYRLNVIPIKIPKGFSGEKHKFILTLMKFQGTPKSKNNFGSQSWRLTLPNFTSSYKATENKTL